MTSTFLRALAACLAACATLLAGAAEPGGRVALLIGNNAYPSSPLRNAVNDARDLGATLRELGFRTIVKENTSRAEMIGALQEFGKALDGADAALFFYAGHAMQFKDRNYLIPIDAVMGSEDDVTFFSVEVSQVFDRMERARTRFNFVILDACRDNPFRDAFKVSATGLAQMSGPSGTLIAYATAPGATAQDGFGRNGVYTGHILQNVKVPDMPVEVLFRKVREGVERDTKRLQTPWELSSIKGDFVFNATGRASGPASAASGPSADLTAQFELQFWKSVQDSNRAEDIRAYLDKYPNGAFAPLARNRLEALSGRTRMAGNSPAPVQPASSTAPGSTSQPASVGLESPPVAKAEDRDRPAPAPVQVAAAKPPETRPADKAVPAVAPVAGTSARQREATNASPPSSESAPPPAPAKPKEELPGREIAPGVRELTFADGSVYRGPMRGIQLQGKGEYVIHGKGEYVSKAFRYEGEFKDGMKHGVGAHSWENGDRYEGEFADDKPSGKGRYQFANGDTYDGEVKAGSITGRGTYVTKAGDRIEGSFSDGRAQGAGIYRFASGDRYEGELVGGRIQGKGRYYTKGGDRIEGSFVDGRAQGQGTYFYSNGDRYEGAIRDGALSGTGAYFYASGSKYEGEMANALPQGKGTFWFVDGSRFEGQFEQGLKRAKGAVIRPDGSTTPAEIVDGAVRLLN